MIRLNRRVGTAFFKRFGSPNATQDAAIDAIVRGHDVIVRAGTGSGKTEAAAAPLTQRYESELDRGEGVVVLFISPTRALANDLLRRLEPVYSDLGMLVGVRHGERKDTERVRPPDVLITTPESLDVMLTQREPLLSTVQAVVLDEIHLLANGQRGLQLGICLHRTERFVGRTLQVVGLSATAGDPIAIWQFYRPGTTPTVIEGAEPPRPINRQIRIDLDPCELAKLIERAGGPESKILVFVNSRRDCDTVADALREHSGFGDEVFAHHALLSRFVRERAEHDFQQAARAVCVATSTLELGIDIGDVTLVVLYGAPTNWQSLLQRCGRGNRRENVVNALCVVPPKARHQSLLAIRLGFQALFDQVDTDDVDTAGSFGLYGAAAQQLVSEIYTRGGAFTEADDLVELLAPWPHLDRPAVIDMLDELVTHEVLQRHPRRAAYGADEGLWQFRERRDIWSNLPLGAQRVKITHGPAEIGEAPASALLSVEPGVVFLLAGKRWQVVACLDGVIKVVPTKAPPELTIKAYTLAPEISAAVIDQMRVLVDRGAPVDDVSPASVADMLEHELRPLFALAEPATVPCGSTPSGTTYLTFAGKTVNQVLAGWAGSDARGCSDFVLRTDRRIELADIPDAAGLLRYLGRADVDEDQVSEFQKLLPLNLRKRELENQWVNRPIHDRLLTRLRNAKAVPLPDEAFELL